MSFVFVVVFKFFLALYASNNLSLWNNTRPCVRIYYCATSLRNHRLFLIPHFELWNLSLSTSYGRNCGRRFWYFLSLKRLTKRGSSKNESLYITYNKKSNTLASLWNISKIKWSWEHQCIVLKKRKWLFRKSFLV